MEIVLKNILGILFAAIVFIAVPARAQDAEKIVSAQSAAKSWLELTDSAEYSKSWEQAAAFFQSAVPKSNWQTTIQSVRSPLGGLKSRTVKSATFTRSLPGAPAGEYVVIQYESQFERKPNAIETVTPMREKDGSWKVSGYFIK